MDIKHKLEPFCLHGATAAPLGQKPLLGRKAPNRLSSELSLVFGLSASPRPRVQQPIAAKLGHRETCQLKLRAVENVDHGLALRLVVTEPVVALELVPLHRNYIVTAVPADDLLFHPRLPRGDVFVCHPREDSRLNEQKGN